MQQRVIKFRAYSEKFGGMIYPDGKLEIRIDTTGIGVHSVWDDARDDECVHVMQFTGLLDKNGNEVWEHDIIYCAEYYEKRHGVIEYDILEARFSIRWLSKTDFNTLLHVRIDAIEVIGTIHTNKHLLP